MDDITCNQRKISSEEPNLKIEIIDWIVLEESKFERLWVKVKKNEETMKKMDW